MRMQPDWDALRTIPVRQVVETATLGDTLHLLFEDNRREAAAKAIDAMPAERRDLVWLTVLARNMGQVEDGIDHGLHGFFFLNHGALAPQVLGALKRIGLAGQAMIFEQAMAACGTPYPIDRAIRERPFAWSQAGTRIDEFTTIPNEPNAFDQRLFALGAGFGSRDATWATIERIVSRDPALTAWVEDARAARSDTDRLHRLSRVLFVDDEVGAATLATWPRPYRVIYLLNQFNDQMLNGSVHQFFFNSSGAYAPQFVAALREVGLETHASAVERGIAMFRAPYPADTERRRREYFRHEGETEFDKALDALTGDVDDGAIPTAMVEFAKRESILPY